MNRSETRRLVVILLPAALLLVLAVVITALLLRGGDDSIAPRIGVDHWHARYEFVACGEKQPNAPEWHSGVRTEADGIIHIHPFETFEEGRGARLVKWFEYGGGELTDDRIRMPGSDKDYRNGDKCPDGAEGVLRIFVASAPRSTEESLTERRLDDWSEYIPEDGDTIRIVFGPEP